MAGLVYDLPIFMWGMLRKGVDPTINAVAIILMVLPVTIGVIDLRVTRYRGRSQRKVAKHR
jgi:ABC-type spermidine/putrescine transport system permease subunit II